MLWRDGLAVAKSTIDLHGRLEDGTPRVTRELILGILRAAATTAKSYGVAWDPFLPVLAALGYTTAGDKFGRRITHPGQVTQQYAIDPVFAQQLVEPNATRYVWSSLAGLAEKLDATGHPIPASGGALSDAFYRDTLGDTATKEAAQVAWARLLVEREMGREPSWADDVEHQVVADAWGTQIPGRPGEIIPVDPKPPIDPTLPPVTGPATPDVGGLLLLLGILYLATR